LVTRRDFLKLASISAAAAGASLVRVQGVERSNRAAFIENGVVATLCMECPAACALKLLVARGRILDVQPNPEHPLACPAPCDGLEAALRRLDSPARLSGPLRRSSGRGGGFQGVSWAAAAALVGELFSAYQPGEIAFVVGDTPDHLNDLVRRLAFALGGATVLRISPAGLLDGRVTLQDAAQRLFGLPRLPYFDLPHADLVFAFGAGGDEPWLARSTRPSSRPAGQAWVHFAPLRPLVAAGDLWINIRPGSEALLAQALGSLVASIKSGADLEHSSPAEVLAASQASGVPPEDLLLLARSFAGALAPLAIPGSGCLGQSGGMAAAQSVLRLNLLIENLGRPGGVYLAPQPPLNPGLSGRTATLAEAQALVQRMEAGQVKALFIHGVDLVAGLPGVQDAGRALEKVERIVSFSALRDETSPYADALLPDHLPLEGWGYQRFSPAADRPLVSAIQPAFLPRCNTRSTTDLLLEAARHLGGKLAASLPYWDEQEFLRQAVSDLTWGGAADPWAQWLAQGGWWTSRPGLLPPVSLRPLERLPYHASTPWPLDPSGAEFYLQFANFPPGLPGIAAQPNGPPPVALHPAALQRLGLRLGDTVRLHTAVGEIEALVGVLPDVRPDTLVLAPQPGLNGGPNPFDLVKGEQNESGDLASQSGRVRVWLPV
jgi:anaerobic selenocysteine-containing dehydrogenase